jgi:hypothetical protein
MINRDNITKDTTHILLNIVRRKYPKKNKSMRNCNDKYGVSISEALKILNYTII